MVWAGSVPRSARRDPVGQGRPSGMSETIACFVMSGGVGTRLWPLSREDNPKQFHDFSGDGSMLVKSLRRLCARPGGQAPVYLIASERHSGRIAADIAGIDLSGGRAIFEPVGRNTAAAVAIATLQTLEAFGDALVLVAPSDHEIATEAQFWQSVERGVPAARAGRLVLFGVPAARPDTAFGYVEASGGADGLLDVTRFVEKPDFTTAQELVAGGRAFWNAGMVLFRAGAMRDALQAFQPDIWAAAEAAFAAASADLSGLYLPAERYDAVPATSIDYAVLERAHNLALVPASFRWTHLGSWKSLLDSSASDAAGNVVIGDVVAIDCENSYLRSEGGLLSAVGLRDMAVVSTPDATFVAPVSRSQNVRKVVEQLEKSGRLEAKFTPAPDRVPVSGEWRGRVQHWLFDETLPLWSTAGVDERHGGFHEALGFDATPLGRPKRMRTMARQVYAFAVAKGRGWDGPADRLIGHGLDFMQRGRTARGGWVRTFAADGTVIDPVEDAYDHSCVLLALAYAHMCGNADAARLADETFDFLDEHLEDHRLTGFLETPDGEEMRRQNPHMHLLEAFLAWHTATGERAHLRRAARIIDLFRSHFFDPETWTLGEFFGPTWKPAAGERGDWTEPGHHFEWASLLTDFAAKSGQHDLLFYARKLYASAVANGLNRATGLAYGAVSRHGLPLDTESRSWPQAEAIKAALALDGTDGPDLKPEIEARVGRLFRWHIDPAPLGMWIDRIDERGRSQAREVPASIFYHLVCALTQYLDGTAPTEP